MRGALRTDSVPRGTLTPFTAKATTRHRPSRGVPAQREALEQHLAGCAECRATLTELRVLVSAARALPEAPPEPDPWPRIAHALVLEPGPRARARPWPLVLAFAAGALATLGALGWNTRDEEAVPQADFLLLAHRAPETVRGLDPAAHAELTARHGAWARSLGAHFLGGDALEGRGFVLRAGSEPQPLGDGPTLGGYFLLAGREREILSLAADSPHLEGGGWFELRPLATR